STQNGQVTTTYLGDTSTQWCTVLAWDSPDRKLLNHESSPGSPSSLVAAWPLEHSKKLSISIYDSATATVIQKILLDAPPKGLSFDREGFGLLWTENKLFGLEFESSNSVARMTPK